MICYFYEVQKGQAIIGAVNNVCTPFNSINWIQTEVRVDSLAETYGRLPGYSNCSVEPSGVSDLSIKEVN
jgi:hypothetical protein